MHSCSPIVEDSADYAPVYAPTLEDSDHLVVSGQTKYYQIFFNHRFAFVMASDVDVVSHQE